MGISSHHQPVTFIRLRPRHFTPRTRRLSHSNQTQLLVPSLQKSKHSKQSCDILVSFPFQPFRNQAALSSILPDTVSQYLQTVASLLRADHSPITHFSTRITTWPASLSHVSRQHCYCLTHASQCIEPDDLMQISTFLSSFHAIIVSHLPRIVPILQKPTRPPHPSAGSIFFIYSTRTSRLLHLACYSVSVVYALSTLIYLHHQ